MATITGRPEVNSSHVTGFSAEYLDRLLVETQHDITSSYIPVIVVVAFFGLVGIIGNVFTITFYGFHKKQSSSIALITYLASADLVVCVLFGFLIMEMALNVNYPSRALCKIAHFCGHYAITTSVFILGFIGIDRHRKICKPFGKQVSLVVARRVVAFLVFMALLISVRDFANFDINHIDIPKPDLNITLTGFMCSNTDDPDRKTAVSIFHMIDTLILVADLIILCVTYGHIIYRLCQITHVHEDHDLENTHFENPMKQNHHGVKDVDEMDTEITGKMTESSDIVGDFDKERNGEDLNRNGECPVKRKAKVQIKKDGKIKRSEKNITKMMLVVSCGFVACFAPYFIIKLGLRSSKTSVYELSAGIQLLLRFPYLNSVINPIVFCVFNPQFRRFIARTLRILDSQGASTSESSAVGSGTTDDLQI